MGITLICLWLKQDKLSKTRFQCRRDKINRYNGGKYGNWARWAHRGHLQIRWKVLDVTGVPRRVQAVVFGAWYIRGWRTASNQTSCPRTGECDWFRTRQRGTVCTDGSSNIWHDTTDNYLVVWFTEMFLLDGVASKKHELYWSSTSTMITWCIR